MKLRSLMRTKAPCAGQGIAQYGIAADGPGPERPEAGKSAGAFVVVIEGRQALGTVRRIVVITAAVPGIDAGRAPGQPVLGQQRHTSRCGPGPPHRS